MKTLVIYEGETAAELPNFYVEDFGQTLNFHIMNENTSAVDLTDYTITIKAISMEDDSVLFSGSCAISNAVSGYCNYSFVDGDLSAAGSYIFELELVKTGVKETINLGYLNLLTNL